MDKYTDIANKLIDANSCFYDATDTKAPSVAFRRAEGVEAIAALLRQAVEEEREACAALCETEASEITIARISAASTNDSHAIMRAEARSAQNMAALIRARGEA